MKYTKASSPHDSAKAQGRDLHCHFKNTRETCQVLKHMTLTRAKQFLANVINHKEAVPFRRFAGGVGRNAQTNTAFSCPRGRWPVKSAKYVLDLLRNAEANAEIKGLAVDELKIRHIQANMSVKGRRRTYRAHGRINAYMSCPSNIEVILTPGAKPTVKKAAASTSGAEADDKKKKVSKKRQEKEKLGRGLIRGE